MLGSERNNSNRHDDPISVTQAHNHGQQSYHLEPLRHRNFRLPSSPSHQHSLLHPLRRTPHHPSPLRRLLRHVLLPPSSFLATLPSDASCDELGFQSQACPPKTNQRRQRVVRRGAYQRLRRSDCCHGRDTWRGRDGRNEYNLYRKG